MKFIWRPFERGLFFQLLGTNVHMGIIADAVRGFTTSKYLVDNNVDIISGSLELHIDSTNISFPIEAQQAQHGIISVAISEKTMEEWRNFLHTNAMKH
jgi:hypothetical protein